MSLRMIEMILPQEFRKDLETALKEQEILDQWLEPAGEGRIHLKLLVPTGSSEKILDVLETRFSHIKGFRIILMPVEASIPRPDFEDEKKKEKSFSSESKQPVSKIIRISREELYSDIEKTVRLSWVFIALVIISAIVVSIGILKNNVVYIIGAMVIAPVLGPNLALSFGTTLGDSALIRRSIKTIGIGVVTALIPSLVIGAIFFVNPNIPELVARTQVDLGDVVIALAAGSAAAISFTSDLFSALIGVMVAVALLPPLVTLGLLVGAGRWELALGSLLLFFVNMICVNLAGVLSFLIQGIRPLTWWETKKAKKSTKMAILIWTALLMTLVILLILS